MSETKSYEEDKVLPSVLVVSKFTAARGKEIQIMKNALSSASGTKLAFQKLPRHMRRRAMAHNAKRLPRRLREIHLNQMKKSGLVNQQKRSSRKYRRRPGNLMDDYMRRRKRCQWLDTHIWHAKRFHMVEKWGFKLPFRSCDKTYRACYRATISHCLLQDISYYHCIEISGNYNIIVDHFKKISDSQLGLTIGAKAYSKGLREGSITLFRTDNKKAIGKVYFNWKPVCNNLHAVIWIWMHAAFYDEALNNFIDCFNFKIKSMKTDFSSDGRCFTNIDGVNLKELRLSRFRLTGPLSNSVLQNCFHAVESSESVTNWIQVYNGDICNQMQLQKGFWTNIKNISSTTQLPPHMILSLVVEDPRLYFPKKRMKSVSVIKPSEYSYPLSETLAEGPIWNHRIRKVAKDEKPSNAALVESRRNLLVPGSDVEGKKTPVPIMLIQRPGNKYGKEIGYSSGWDIVIPPGWAQPIWVSLIMWGARPGGLKETNSINFEMGQPDPLYPDTSAGVEEEKFTLNQYKEVYFRLPPNKRINYNKFKIASPFTCNWTLLLSEWNQNESPVTDFFVLRDQRLLKNIQELLSSKAKNVNSLDDHQNNCLIPVSIKLVKKGLCKKFSIICLPKKEDLMKVPTEEKCLDKNEMLRKELRRDHKLLLKRLKRRRAIARKNREVIPIDTEMLSNYKNKMRELWLPKATTIRHSCSREVIGFVKDGDFSLLLGQSKAIGYIAMSAISVMLSSACRNKVLVRNTNSKHYHLGTLEVIL